MERCTIIKSMSIEKIQYNNNNYNKTANNAISRKLKIAMAKKEMRQKELARLTGKSVSAVSAWVRGDATPSVDTLKKIAEVLCVSESYFICSDAPQVFSNEQNCIRKEFLKANILRKFDTILARAENCEGGLEHLNLELDRSFPETLYGV